MSLTGVPEAEKQAAKDAPAIIDHATADLAAAFKSMIDYAAVVFKGVAAGKKIVFTSTVSIEDKEQHEQS